MRRYVGALVVALVMVSASPVLAQEGTCKLDPDTGLLKCVLVAQPSPPRTVRLSDDLPLVWMRLPLNDFEIMRLLNCIRTVGGVDEVGNGNVVILLNSETNEQLYLRYICTWPGETPPQPPPPPPTPAEFATANAEVLTLSPSLSPSASIGGLTGLDSWLWCADPGPVGTGVSLRGWTASGSVQLAQLGWEIGTDELAQTSTSCGSQEAPSVTWTPEAIGEYPITLTSVWAGSWDLTWNGIPMGTFLLGPVSLTSPPQPYPVDEYRGELTG